MMLFFTAVLDDLPVGVGPSHFYGAGVDKDRYAGLDTGLQQQLGTFHIDVHDGLSRDSIPDVNDRGGVDDH